MTWPGLRTLNAWRKCTRLASITCQGIQMNWVIEGLLEVEYPNRLKQPDLNVLIDKKLKNYCITFLLLRLFDCLQKSWPQYNIIRVNKDHQNEGLQFYWIEPISILATCQDCLVLLGTSHMFLRLGRQCHGDDIIVLEFYNKVTRKKISG